MYIHNDMYVHTQMICMCIHNYTHIRHVTRVNEQVTSHVWISHVTHVSASRCIPPFRMLSWRVNETHTHTHTHTQIHKSRHTCRYIMAHACTPHAAYTYTWVVRICLVTNDLHACDVTHWNSRWLPLLEFVEAFTSKHTHTRTQTCTHTCTHAHTHTHTHIHTHTHAHAHAHTSTHTYIHTRTHARAHSFSLTHCRSSTDSHPHVHRNTYIHIYTHSLSLSDTHTVGTA